MSQKKDQTPDKEKKPAIKPDPETLHTPDPQEHMEGPISSLMQAGKKKVEEIGGETGEEENDDDQKNDKDKK